MAGRKKAPTVKYHPVFTSGDRGVLENSVEDCNSFECYYKKGLECTNEFSGTSICDDDTDCAFKGKCWCCAKKPNIDETTFQTQKGRCPDYGIKTMLDKKSLPEDEAASKRAAALINSDNKDWMTRGEDLVEGVIEMAEDADVKRVDREHIDTPGI